MKLESVEFRLRRQGQGQRDWSPTAVVAARQGRRRWVTLAWRKGNRTGPGGEK